KMLHLLQAAKNYAIKREIASSACGGISKRRKSRKITKQVSIRKTGNSIPAPKAGGRPAVPRNQGKETGYMPTMMKTNGISTQKSNTFKTLLWIRLYNLFKYTAL